MVDKGAAVRLAIERPAGAMHHQTFVVTRRLDIPKFLDADRIGLRIAIARQVKPGDQLPPRWPREPSANKVYLPRSSTPG